MVLGIALGVSSFLLLCLCICLKRGNKQAENCATGCILCSLEMMMSEASQKALVEHVREKHHITSVAANREGEAERRRKKQIADEEKVDKLLYRSVEIGIGEIEHNPPAKEGAKMSDVRGPTVPANPTVLDQATQEIEGQHEPTQQQQQPNTTTVQKNQVLPM